MQRFNHDNGGSDGDWDHGGELAWNEADWQLYLKRAEQEQRKFIELYLPGKGQEGHLDEVAKLMEWDREDWSAPGGGTDDVEDEVDFDFSDVEPYTIQKHPVFIVTHALTRWIEWRWACYTQTNWAVMRPKMLHRFSSGCRESEVNAVMALDALEMGDFNLAVCLLKRALAALNAMMQAVFEVPGRDPEAAEAFQTEVSPVLFDLREVWLRVLCECRIEARVDDDVEGDPS